MLTIADIDQHLSQQGHFCLIDWLLAQNFLLYPHYEGWRHGGQAYLDTALQMDRPRLQTLLNDADRHCRALGLSHESQTFHHWDHGSYERPAPLFASEDSKVHEQLTRQWLRPQDRPQLDLFMDNAAVVAENHLCDALGSRQFDRASEHLNELTRLNSQHSLLGRYQDLVNYGRHMQAKPRITPEHITTELDGLQYEVLPLARELLAQSARDYLAFAWRRLAGSLVGSSVDKQTDTTLNPDGSRLNPDDPRLHPSFALAQIPDWPAVRDCVAEEPTLQQQPHLLERLASAYSALQQHEKTLLLWCLLFEAHTEHAEATIQHAPLAVNTLWQEFWELEETLNEAFECAWFSPFILSKQPGLIHHLDGSPALAHPATLAIIDLVKARQTAADEIPARKQLKAVHATLLRLYQATTTPRRDD